MKGTLQAHSDVTPESHFYEYDMTSLPSEEKQERCCVDPVMTILKWRMVLLIFWFVSIWWLRKTPILHYLHWKWQREWKNWCFCQKATCHLLLIPLMEHPISPVSPNTHLHSPRSRNLRENVAPTSFSVLLGTEHLFKLISLANWLGSSSVSSLAPTHRRNLNSSRTFSVTSSLI